MSSHIFLLVSKNSQILLLVNKYLLNAYYAPDATLGARDVAVTKAAQITAPWGVCSGSLDCAWGGAGGRR
jgi:hypothetical protein